MVSSTVDLVIKSIEEVLEENQQESGDITSSSNLLKDTGLDSLGLALVVVKLEEQTGKDPFANGFRNFHTVAELAALYDE